MIDTHCHLTYNGLAARVDAVLADAAAAGVDRVISVGTTVADAEAAVSLAARFEAVYATAGLHPGYSGEVTDYPALKAALRELLNRPRVVAIGEMGLDLHYPEPTLAQQRPVFAAQLELMAERPGLRGVIHNREATPETLAMIADHGISGDRLVFHCFTGTESEVQAILATGAWVSFTGIVTFGSADGVARASDHVPLDRLMIETDSPYLTPAPHRKIRPNEPKYVADVARFLADRRGMSLGAFVETVDRNAERFFGLESAAPKTPPG
ncbi:MAG: TatD family hydrolase [Planctomycetota bacterium]